MEIYIITAVVILIITAIITIFCISKRKKKEPVTGSAGHPGEELASNVIRQFLHKGDYLFTNVSIEQDEKRAELDNVVVNKNGVFIIEVKNYSGRLIGREDDSVWKKVKYSKNGYPFGSEVKNPIKQVKRQIYILAQCLKTEGLDIWIKGYAILIRGNSPIRSRYILQSIDDIDRAIHSFGRTELSGADVKKIRKYLAKRQEK